MHKLSTPPPRPPPASALLRLFASGSKAHEFVNAPLVLDYMQLKWSCTIPNWTRRYPLDYNVNEGFYTYGNTDKDGKHVPTWADSLLRLPVFLRLCVGICVVNLTGSMLWLFAVHQEPPLPPHSKILLFQDA